MKENLIRAVLAASLLAAPVSAAAAEEAGPPPDSRAADEARAGELVRLLGSEAWAEREKASEELVRLGGAALGALAGALRSEDPEVFWRVLAALVSIGPDARETLKSAAADARVPQERRLRVEESLRRMEGPAFLGVQIADGSAPAAGGNGAGGQKPETHGASVVEVLAASPAERAGLRKDDLITAVDGKAVAGAAELTREVRRRRPGAKVSLRLLRGGGAVEVEARLGAPPAGVEIPRPVEEDGGDE